MSKRIAFMSMVFLLAMVLAWGPVHSENLKKGCCIAGNYKGVNRDLASESCKDPETGKFTMVIYQDKKCGSKVWGKVQGENPDSMRFEGTVTWQGKGCCLLTGVIRETTTGFKPTITKKPTHIKKPFSSKRRVEEIKIKAIICKKRGKWVVKDGKYKHSWGCGGTFTMEQVLRIKLVKSSIK